MNGQGKYSEFGEVEGDGGRRSFNILDKQCYFSHNSQLVLQDAPSLLSNPGPAFAFAPNPTPTLRGPGGQHGYGPSENNDHAEPIFLTNLRHLEPVGRLVGSFNPDTRSPPTCPINIQ